MKNSLMNLAKTPLAALALSLALAGMAHAGTLDEVKSLWDPRGISGTETASPQSDTPQAVSGASQPRWLRLSNGKQVDLRDWKVVLFMQGHCPYCHKFDPVLKQLAGQYGFSVFSYTIDGQGDDAFPEALPAPPDVMQTFFPQYPGGHADYVSGERKHAGSVPDPAGRHGCTGLYGQSGYGISDDALSLCYIRS